MATLEQLYNLFETYKQKAKTVRSKASRFAGAFSLGDDPRLHGCHEQFYEDVGLWAEEFVKGNPSPEEISEAAHWLLETAPKYRDEDVYWYLYAIHAHAKMLIPLLTEQDCRQLRKMYDDTYPVLDRLPTQKEVYQLLKRHSGGEPESNARKFPFFWGKK